VEHDRIPWRFGKAGDGLGTDPIPWEAQAASKGRAGFREPSVVRCHSRAGPSASTRRPENCLRIDDIVELVGDTSQGVP
jgi:hypothetical protein